MKTIKKIKTNKVEETIKVAADFAKKLAPGTIVGLIGELGAGKTIFTKGLARALKIKDMITSPSYTIFNIYQTPKIALFHFDLYRLNSIEELENIGYEEYFYGKGISVIEWAEKCIEILPKKSYLIYFKHVDKNTREIQICRKK